MKTLSTRAVVCFFTFFISICLVHAQQFQWVHGGGTVYNYGSSPSHEWEQTKYMCTDPNGNIYALSQVGDDPVVADTFHQISYGDNPNLLLTSYTCSGQMRWAKLLSNNGYGVTPFSIQADSLGNIYVAGSFAAGGGTMYIGYDTTISPPASDYLSTGLIQFDTAGHFKWIRYIGANTFASESLLSLSNTLAIDGANNAHYFCDMLSGVPLMTGVTSVYGVYDLTYNPTGTLLSAVRLDLDSSLQLTGATIDKHSNKTYVYGYRSLSFTDSSSYTFIASFDPIMNRVWIDTISDPADPVTRGFFSGIAADGIGHIYLSGAGDGYLVYMGDTIAPPVGGFGGYLSFIMKADTNGHMDWASKCDGSSVNGFSGMTLVPGNKIAAAGTFVGTIHSGTITIHSDANYDPFFAVVDTSGGLMTLQRINGDGYNNGANAITADNSSNLYIGGEVADTIPDTLIPAYHSIGGNTDFFILKYGVDCSCTSMPVANYTDTGTTTVGFTYTGTTTPAIDSMRWNFGDGGTNALTNPVHTYTANGTYSACVTVYSACGSDLHCSNIVVTCATPPVASYTNTGTPTVTYTYTGTTSGMDSIRWNFGDGGTSTLTNPSHTYTAIGTYSVCVTMYSVCGAASFCNAVSILCLTPVAASYSYSVTAPAASFTYTGTAAGIDSVRWNFGDGGTSTLTNPSYTYTAAGTYSVCVTVYTGCGSDVYCQDVVIPCVTAPTVSYAYTGSPTVNFTYTGTTTGIDSVRWSFGDGGTSTLASPSYTYTATGTYSVCVTAYSACGSNTACNTIVIPCIVPPTASFADTGMHTIGFTYTGTTAGIDSIVWNFGDGSTSTATDPLHAYTATGSYHVCVTVYTGCGSDSSCSNVTAIPTGIAALSFTNVQVFPNPATDELYITGVQLNTSYRLLNVTGVSMQEGVLDQGSNTLSMKKYAPGVYILEMTEADGARNMTRVVKE